MARLLAAALVAFAVTTAAVAVAAPAPKTVTFAAKSGKVTFDHEKHAKGAGACKACHAGAPAKLGGKEKAHALCLDCHKAKGAGPQKCGDCHKKA